MGQKPANRIVQRRNERQQQQQRQPYQQRRRREKKRDWQYDQLMLSLPILNVGYPKTGSSTLHSYFTCIGLKSNHMQNGARMVKLLANGNHTILSGFPNVHTFMQLDHNFGVGYYPQISLLDELHE